MIDLPTMKESGEEEKLPISQSMIVNIKGFLGGDRT